MREDYGFEDGLFTGYDAEKRKYDKSSWTYELDENGFAKRDTTLQHPRCVWNLLKQHVSRYTPDVVEDVYKRQVPYPAYGSAIVVGLIRRDSVASGIDCRMRRITPYPAYIRQRL